jgi:hypothetical protein
MNNMRKIVSLFLGLVVFSANVKAWNDPSKSAVGSSSLQQKAAGCTPATGRKILEFNNVSALIETGGSMWQDRSKSDAAYEVPKGSGERVIYAGALWMGGLDVNNQLKLAALTFRQGNDFWSGPLTVIPGTGDINQGYLDYGPAEITSQLCVDYDQFYITTRQEVELFNAYYECKSDPANCDLNTEFEGYSIPSSIVNWPGIPPTWENDNIDQFLAPFYDRNGDDYYDPEDGDYPWYDLNSEINCRTNRKVTLYGDYNMWWVFNDKGNIHTETGGDPIGMEIRAQAFAFATNDEINSMTFYNYEMINRSTQTLTNTYFAVWVDSDIGCSEDDYVGCDVQRGLGYSYNADAIDNDGCNGAQAIGANPPAIGVDFFEGPYQDNDGLDNPLTTDISLAKANLGIPYEGLGIGYGDGTIDNERYGMKRFTYFDRTLPGNIYGDPGIAIEFYNYMLGKWKDNTPFVYGGTGNSSDQNATNILTNYCFPGDSDPYNWATEGTDPGFLWSEQYPTGLGSTANPKGDRRFVQAAGPFTLEPGALNNITYGVVYAKASSGDPFQSVELVMKADDKAQALFDNCFRILNGPDSPEMAIQELDKELILYLNKTESVELYEEVDPIILSYGISEDSAKYVFEGYQIFQVVDESVDPSELDDVDRARLVAQCDITNGVTQLVNYPFDDDLGAGVPIEMVNGSDDGIKHSFKVTQDAFAQGDLRLINFKKYYFMVLAYGYNSYKEYSTADPTLLDGQQFPYKAGRKTVSGGSITSYVGIPHIPIPELGGTLQLTEYGSGPKITRIEGRGNATNMLELTPESEQLIIEQYTPQEVTYENGFGPVDVKVIDPLQVKGGDYSLKILGYGASLNATAWMALDSAQWVLTRESGGVLETVSSDQSIQVGNEQLIPEWGISVYIEQYAPEAMPPSQTYKPALLTSSVEFADSSKQWLSAILDEDGAFPANWIRSGTAEEDANVDLFPVFCDDPASWNDYAGVDDLESMESVLDGAFGPYRLLAAGDCNHELVSDALSSTVSFNADMKFLSSVDIVFTSDRSKWTRCPVLETQSNPDLSWDGNTKKQEVKEMPSIDKYGVPTTNPSSSSSNAADANYISGEGMGWFPGYVIDVSSGERLNVAYGEDSWLGNNGGKDMMFNPSGNNYTQFGDPLFGGKHYLYIFRNASKDPNSWDKGTMPAYDAGQWYMDNYTNTGQLYKIWYSCMWAGIPILNNPSGGGFDFNVNTMPSASDPVSFIETDVKIKLRVCSPYLEMGANMTGWSASQNDWDPYYTFKMDDIAVVNNDAASADSACDLLNVVPNPYYAYSNYERNKLDNVVKIVNLPDVCTINIYTVNGSLVRTFKKDSPVTFIDWDLKNYANIPIASGVYLIHIKVEDGCERVLKWFGVVRPPDLDQF